MKQRTVACCWVCLACFTAAACTHAQPKRQYDVLFTAHLSPGGTQVSIELTQDARNLIELDLSMPKKRYLDVSADGEWRREGNRILWQPPTGHSVLKYRYRIANKRDNGAWDARIDEHSALLRSDDLFPSANARMRKGAYSRSQLLITAPKGWSVETQYGPMADKPRPMPDSERRFDRPTGWLVAGDLGVRREIIAGVRVSAAAVKGSELRRNDVLAFLNWNLGELKRVLGSFPERLLIVGADDPFWRGGLSAPASLYMHSDRPLISENGTSTLLHELVHVATGLSAPGDDDWLVEGIAEYYSLEVMRRTGTITAKRYSGALEWLDQWGHGATQLRAARAKGPTTALAVSLLARLDRELRDLPGNLNLDAVLQGLSEVPDQVTFERLRTLTQALAGRELPAVGAMRKRLSSS